MYKKQKFLFPISTLLAIVLFSCSTEKNTPMRRAFHNTTSKFNVYFNGKESFKAGEKKIAKVPENYTILLPVFPVQRKEVALVASSEMDAVIKKSVKLIKFHSITNKPVRKNSSKARTKKEKAFYNKNEYNKWVDDAYLLIGKANFYKHEHRLALKSLLLIITKFKTEETRFDAMLWAARTYTELGDYKDAITYLELIKSEKKIQKEQLKTQKKTPAQNFFSDILKKQKKHDLWRERQVDLIYTDIFIRQKEYAKALVMLDRAINKTKRKKKKARLKFLLAQLNQKMGNETVAADLYAEVVKINPNYDMTFSAKINLARSSGAENLPELRKILTKMLKDDKNIDYFDQIYYALAEVEMKAKDEPAAVENYLLSAEKSTTNADQKALSFLALADIFFARPEYIPANAYYDSTMTALDKKHPDYQEISRKAKNLGSLIDNLRIIAFQDSVQRVAKMPEEKRNQIIANIIEEIKAEERRKKAENNTVYVPSEVARDISKKGKWYFYNPAAMAMGRSEFQKKWGRRKLSDNWRRKNKAITLVEHTDNNENADSSRVTDNKKPAFYLQDLPLTDSMVVASDAKIAQALYTGAGIYEKKMKDYPEAEKLYLQLTKRFPKNRYTIEAYFNLYLINYKLLNNKIEAEKYRQIILKKYPDSKYANILTDPNYLKKLEATKDIVNTLYSQAYNAYQSKNYNTTITKSEKAISISPGNDLSPKLLFLKALSLGELGKTQQMVVLLKTISQKYPKSEITPRAKDILKVIASGKFKKDLFKFEENAKYYYAIVLKKDKQKIRSLRFQLVNYGIKKFPDKKFKIEQVTLKDSTVQLLVKLMDGKNQAMQFFNGLKTGNVLKEVPTSDYVDFVISEGNFKKMQKLKETSKYMAFFKEQYFPE